MSFYSEICQNYDQIFPLKQVTLNFLSKELDDHSHLLDVACATGSYSFELSKQGHKVLGIDLDEGMIKMAQAKYPKIPFEVRNMLHINEIEEEFDQIFCIGNSLVHLGSLEEIKDFFIKSHQRLKSNGLIKIQIINYDRILDQGIKELPTITTDHLSFIRKYELSKDQRFVSFNTELITKEERYENSVKLLTLNKHEVETLLKETNYKDIEFFANFKGDPYDKGAIPLIFCAKKA